MPRGAATVYNERDVPQGAPTAKIGGREATRWCYHYIYTSCETQQLGAPISNPHQTYVPRRLVTVNSRWTRRNHRSYTRCGHRNNRRTRRNTAVRPSWFHVGRDVPRGGAIAIQRRTRLNWFRDVWAPEVASFLASKGLPQKALLILDNAPSHPNESFLSMHNGMMKAKFLPPNVTSLIQPMDQGDMLVEAFL